jgi:cytochrome c2
MSHVEASTGALAVEERRINGFQQRRNIPMKGLPETAAAAAAVALDLLGRVALVGFGRHRVVVADAVAGGAVVSGFGASSAAAADAASEIGSNLARVVGRRAGHYTALVDLVAAEHEGIGAATYTFAAAADASALYLEGAGYQPPSIGRAWRFGSYPEVTRLISQKLVGQ